MREVNDIVKSCNSWPEGSEDAALHHGSLFGVQEESLGCVDRHLPSEFGHETACTDECAGRPVLHTGHGGRISAHTMIEPFHLHMYNGTINLSPEFDDAVLAGPYPKAAGHTQTYDECGNTKGNEFDGCNTSTIYESPLAN